MQEAQVEQSLEHLFTGIAVVIDDEVKKSDANISKLIKQIDDKHIPYVTFEKLPATEIVKHLDEISFLILDWKLSPVTDENLSGVKKPATLQESDVSENIKFLKDVRKYTFDPIFIFTNEKIEDVTNALKKEGLYEDGKPNSILVMNKSELEADGVLFEKITEWIKNTPSVYVLKVWEDEYKKAKNSLFNDFYALSSSWPKILWNSFKDDGVDESISLGDLISRNLHTRMSPFSFSADVIAGTQDNNDKDELRRVLGGERFIKNDGLHSSSISPGDFFKVGDNFYINIRPDCDCVARETDSADTLNLYLLKASKMSQNQESDAYSPKFGNFQETDGNVIVFNMYDSKTFKINFKELEIKTWGELKDKRLGRLLPPYLTRLQQRYGLYQQRHGLPRTPKEAVHEKVEAVAGAAEKQKNTQ